MIKIKDGFHGERSVVVPPFMVEHMQHDPFLSSLYITDIGYYPHAEHHFIQRDKPLHEYVLLYCKDGSGCVTIGNKQHAIHADQYVILPAGETHEYSSDSETPWTIYWIHFTGTLAEYYARDADTPHDVKPGIHSRISNRINLFEEILTVMQTDLTDDNMHYAASILHHFLASLRYLQSYRGADIPTDDTNIIEAAKHYMRENMERHVTLKQVADYVGFSIPYFTMRFHKQTGYSPIDYLNRERIERACEFLTTTTMKINQISYKIGITDSLYFSRLFHKIKGTSPTLYRKEHAKTTL